MTYIKKVETRDDFILEVQLENGSSVLLNLQSRLKTIRFGMLSDKKFFKTVTTDGICIRWNHEIEMSLSEVFQLVQKQQL
jgi:hypothetical protein